jgi:hypothetical protein
VRAFVVALLGELAATMGKQSKNEGDVCAAAASAVAAPAREQVEGDEASCTESPESAPAERPRLNFRDLVAELDSINGEIQRLLSQVDRALATLAMGG